MDNETDIAIAVRDLTVRYKNGHTALHNASFSIKTGHHKWSGRGKWRWQIYTFQGVDGVCPNCRR